MKRSISAGFTAGVTAVGVSLAASLVMPSAVSAVTPDPTPIVFVGDSITELCNVNFNSFRDDALSGLVAAGYLVDAVGNRDTEGGAACYGPDNQHEGRASDDAGEALARLQSTGITGTPEVAFVLLGTNDVQDNIPVGTTIANINGIMALLRSANPSIDIVIAQIPPYPGKATQTAALNNAIGALASGGNSPVTIADFFTGVGAPQLHTDQIHLNANGAALLGARARDALIATGALAVNADVPSPPTALSATAGVRSATVTWNLPTDTGGSPITAYVVEATGVGLTPRSVTVAATPRTATVTGLDIGLYTISVRAENGDGLGLLATTGPITPRRAFGPFDDEAGFLRQQYQDFLGRTADAGGLTYWSGLTNDDQSNVAVIIDGFMKSAEFAPRRSVARLYLAYFDRTPDIGGFDFWATRIASGTASIDTVSQSFVGSPEFQSTYGALDDAQFVALVYRNVLGRAPDQAGYDFWLGRMQAGMNRGRVMTQFSESPEYVVQTRARVDVIVTYAGMLDRRPDQAGYDFWVGRVGNDPNSLATLITGFYTSPEYADRVTP